MNNSIHQSALASISLVSLFAAASLLMGCERRAAEKEPTDKPAEPVPAAASSAPSSPAEQPEQPTPTEHSAQPWTVPAGWTVDAKPRPMRLATYIAPHPDGTAEVAITKFGGRVGGELANINRWRGQMGLKPVAEQELETTIRRFSSPGYDVYETRIDSPTGVMLAAAVYQQSIDQTWFIRATLPNAAAADHLQADLFAMARSIIKP